MTHHPANTFGASALMPQSETAVLDAFLPGYSFFSRLFSSYFHVDISSYLLLIVILMAIGNSPRLRNIVKRHFTSTLEIRYDDEAHRFILFWMAKQPFSKQTPHIVTETESRKDFSWYRSVDDDDDDSDIDATDLQKDMDFYKYWFRAMGERVREPRYTPGAGAHFFWHKGHLIGLARVPYGTNTNAPWLLNAEYITLFCFGRDPTITFLKREGNRIVIYHWQKSGVNFQWARYAPKTLRPLTTVVLDRKQKDGLREDIVEYLHPCTRFWYDTRGIPYRRGYLFSGPPGTGKTSLVLAIVSWLLLDVYLLNLEGLAEGGMIDLFRKLPSKCLLLVEDIDCVGISQTRSDSPTALKQEKDNGSCTRKYGLSRSALLNVIDGAAAREGHLLIMTTHHPEKLDPALTRPGRIDKVIKFTHADRAMIQELFYSIYRASNDSESDSDNNKTIILVTEFANRIPAGKFTAAEFRVIFYRTRRAPKMQLRVQKLECKNVLPEEAKEK
ncbi:hypothetical protein ACJ73_01768 [Blastomyces percursus]|uniref:AAA+ ATPase domain-containing protein n=1 Tax=Blastomyces percursus TaxID=1658174 RepID=A0A1J9RE39_9EURO|nr:hypothetical protein ACJ73_01768 [Blastomyces percursus]